MKQKFVTGLAILLPITITLMIVTFLVNLLTKPFEGIVQSILGYYNLLGQPFLFLSAENVLVFTSKFLILVTLTSVTIFIGMVGQMFIVNHLLGFGDSLMHRIPIINRIYKAVQDVVKTLFTSEDTSFSQVVLVPFPHDKCLNIGLIARNDMPKDSDPKHQGLVSIFVPGTPNPTMGFLLLFRKEQLIYVDMKVEDALKFIVSCGVIYSGFNRITPPGNNSDISPK
jgi:uncharacterized membrane protein